jgi:cation diffusion facilitator CzcD-associated flavoprotein CzcO
MIVSGAHTQVEAIVVGAGFGGLYMVHRLAQDGVDVLGLEAGEDVGGTWYWNRYPGARCDVESLEYSYSFDHRLQQEWQWSERYAAQPEILRYLQHVADRFDLRSRFRFSTEVVVAEFDEHAAMWTVACGDGTQLRCRYLVMASGVLSATNLPDIPGRSSFSGLTLHTGAWPAVEPDLAGRRVGVIGTGSSGVQVIPELAAQAEELVVFQRTATYAAPARNRPLDAAFEAEVKADYDAFRERNRQMWPAYGAHLQLTTKASRDVADAERSAVYEQAWELGGFAFMLSFTDLLTDHAANQTAAEFVRARIRETVTDPDVAERLLPRQPIGCKRLCLDTEYYETFNRDNVRLVALDEDPIAEIVPTGIRTERGLVELDAIVYATGFDAMTGALTRLDLRGRDGTLLRDRWAQDGPVNLLGLAVPGFPNLFMITGPGSPSVLTNVVVAIEQHVQWIARCIAHLRASGTDRIEATEEAADAWVARVNEVADHFIFASCNSWYLGANIPGKPRMFMPMPGFPAYVRACEDVERDGYRGFDLSAAAITEGAGR